MSITVSIVNFNTKVLLRSLLRDVLNQDLKVVKKIVVVDNNSSDGTLDMLKEEFSGKIELIKMQENLGFAKANNQVLNNLKTDYVVLLNPDTKLPNDLFSKMFKFMEDNPKCGIASCKIIGFDGLLHSNGGDFPIGLALNSWLFNLEKIGIKRNFHRIEESYFEKKRKVDWVGGTFMIIKKEVIEKLKGFNEDYFMYFEDVEFCYLATKNGFEVWLNPEIEIKHKSGASSNDPQFRQWLGEFKGVINFYRKTLSSGWLSVLDLRIKIYVSILLRIIIFTLFGKFNTAKTYGKVFISI